MDITNETLLRLAQRAEELLAEWEAKAQDYAADLATVSGHALMTRICQQFRHLATDIGQAEVNLATAAALSGYSTRQLRRMTVENRLTNRGTAGAPRYLVADLPRKVR